MIGQETNPVDLLLVEAMRIFYAPLYEWVRDHADTVLGTGVHGADDRRVELIRTGFARATASLQAPEQVAAKVLLTHLFPRTESAWGNKGWPAEWDTVWAKAKRVAAHDYFQRYFTYGIPVGDISDLDIDQLMTQLDAEDLRDDALGLGRELAARSDSTFVRKLSDREPELGSNAARNAVMLISDVAESLGDLPGQISRSTMDWAARLAAKLLTHLDEPDRTVLSTALLQASEPVGYTLELFRWMNIRKESADGEEAAAFDVQVLGEVLAARIATYWSTDPPLVSLGRRSGSAMYFWHEYGEAGSVTTYFTKRIQAAPDTTVDLIASTLGRAWSMETGIPMDADVGREGYDILAEYDLAAPVFANLLTIYGEQIGEGDYYEGGSGERRLAHQFAYIHRKVQAEAEQQSTEGGPHEESHAPQTADDPD